MSGITDVLRCRFNKDYDDICKTVGSKAYPFLFDVYENIRSSDCKFSLLYDEPGQSNTAIELCKLIWDNYKSDQPSLIPVYIHAPKSCKEPIGEFMKELNVVHNGIDTKKLVIFLGNCNYQLYSMETEPDFKDAKIVYNFPSLIDSQVYNHLDNAGVGLFKEWIIERIPILIELGKNPLILNFIPQILKDFDLEILRNQKSISDEIWKDIYDGLTNKWFQCHIDKSVNANTSLEIPKEDLAVYCRACVINLAKIRLENSILYNTLPLGDIEFINLLEPIHVKEFLRRCWSKHRSIFENNHKYLAVIKSSLPIQFCVTNGRTQFLHYSLLEYFGDQKVFLDILGEYKFYWRMCRKDSEPVQTESVLLLNLLTKINRTYLTNMVNLAVEHEDLVALLFKIIQLSKFKTFLRIMAANAITILNLAGVSLSGQDFRFIQIPNSNLNFSICGNSNFEGSDMTRVSFDDAWLNCAKFQGATLGKLQLGIVRVYSVPNKLPFQADFWRSDTGNPNLYFLISFTCLPFSKVQEYPDEHHGGSIQVFKFDAFTGLCLNENPYKLKIRGKYNQSYNCFQIFEEFIVLFCTGRMKIFNLKSGKKISKSFEITKSDPTSFPTQHHLSFEQDTSQKVLNFFCAEADKMKKISYSQFKFSPSGQFLALIFQHTELNIYKVNLTKNDIQLQPLINVESDAKILGLDFREQSNNRSCVFICKGGICSVDLGSPFNLKIFKTSSKLGQILDNLIDIKDSRSGFVPFQVDPMNNNLIAIHARPEKFSKEKLYIAEFCDDQFQIKYDLDDTSNMDTLAGTQLHVHAVLIYKDNLLVFVDQLAGCKASRIRAWQTRKCSKVQAQPQDLGQEYTLIFTETYQESIDQISVGKCATGIYELSILSFNTPTIKTIQICTQEAIDFDRMDRKSLFESKFFSIDPNKKVHAVKVDRDSNSLLTVLRSASTENPDQIRTIEIWDLAKGRKKFEHTFLKSDKFFFVTWLSRGKLFVIECRKSNDNVTIFENFESLTKPATFQNWSFSFEPETNFPILHSKLDGSDDIFISFTGTDQRQRIELFKSTISGESFNFVKTNNLVTETSVSSTMVYSSIRNYVKHNEDRIPFTEKMKLEMNPHCYNKSPEFNKILNIDSDFFIVSEEAASIWRFVGDSVVEHRLDNLVERKTRFSDCLEFDHFKIIAEKCKESSETLRIVCMHDSSVFKPGKSCKLPDSFTSKIELKAKIKFWFGIDFIYFTKHAGTIFHVLLIRFLEQDMVCLEFDIEKDFAWKVLWGRISYLDFKMEGADIKNVLQLHDSSDKVFKGHGASGTKSILRESYIAKGDIIYPIAGTAHEFPKFSQFGDGKLEFDETTWVISIVILNTPISFGHRKREHPCLIFEGESSCCRRFTFKAELNQQRSNPFIQTKVFKTMQTITDFISKEIITKNWVYFQKRISSDDGDKLINSILLDRRTVYTGLRENCVKWVEDKLRDINIEFKESKWEVFITRALKFKRESQPH